MPHFRPSILPMGIVGENAYQKAIKEIIHYQTMVEKDDREYRDEKLTAHLILEDNNQNDSGNAVRVEIDRQTVGYLARGDAKFYRKALAGLGIAEICTCNAAAFGKREYIGGNMFFGIWLSIDLNRLEIDTAKPKPLRKKLFGLF
jgi:hypothetical protein